MKIEALKSLKSDGKDDKKCKSVSKVKQLKLSFELKMSEGSKDKNLPVSQTVKSKKLIFENVLESARKKIQRGPNSKATKRVNKSGQCKLAGGKTEGFSNVKQIDIRKFIGKPTIAKTETLRANLPLEKSNTSNYVQDVENDYPAKNVGGGVNSESKSHKNC